MFKCIYQFVCALAFPVTPTAQYIVYRLIIRYFPDLNPPLAAALQISQAYCCF